MLTDTGYALEDVEEQGYGARGEAALLQKGVGGALEISERAEHRIRAHLSLPGFFGNDGDIPARYEQTLLMKAALDSFGLGKTAQIKVMHGGHTSYLFEEDAEGNNLFAAIAAEFILNNQK